MSPLHQYKFNALALTRKVACLKDFESEILEAIQRSAHGGDLGWITLALEHRASAWLIQGCKNFLCIPPWCRTATFYAENKLSSSTLVGLYRIKELFDQSFASKDEAPYCYSCHRLVTLVTGDTTAGLYTWLRTCACERTHCIIGVKPHEHLEEVLKEIAVHIFSERYSQFGGKDKEATGHGDGLGVDISQCRKRRKVQY